VTNAQKNTGIAIAIAWPQTYCKQPGEWYDKLFPLIGINKFNYYQVGHAAVVLIDVVNTKCHYFDFGRYHTPFQQGRVRSAVTDYDLKVETVPEISSDNKQLLNYEEILNELQNNHACHGEGKLQASYCLINFGKAYKKAIKIQKESPHSYGPFVAKGSNCSRFVCSVLNAGSPKWINRVKLNYWIPLTPTPNSNVRAFDHKKTIPHPKGKPLFEPINKLDRDRLSSTLPQPVKNRNVPVNTQWLSGEGAGSWFLIKPIIDQIMLSRFSPDGNFECLEFFNNPSIPSNTIKKYKITYPTNCSVVTLEFENKKHSLNRAKREEMPLHNQKLTHNTERSV
jgi:hypothetical protein